MYKIADAHCDYLAYRVLKKDEGRLFDHVDIKRMCSGGIALQNFAVWVPPDTNNKLRLGLEQIDCFTDMINSSGGAVRLCTDSACLNDGRGICAILSIESGESINCDNAYISIVYEKGARIFSLTWNDENNYGSGCLKQGGLKPQGVAAVRLLNRLRIALDVSHINEKGFWEVLDTYEHAPCATHSCVFDLYEHPRNLKKQQIKALIDRDGFIGINFYPEFLKGTFATIDDILDHIDYVLDCGDEHNVGFGSDFCGIEHTPEGLDSAADFQALPEAMAKRNYPESLITQISYGNFARYILKFLNQ